MQLPKAIENYKITVMDLSGRIVRQEKGNGNNLNTVVFESKTLNSGLYLYTITQANGATYLGRFVIQKE